MDISKSTHILDAFKHWNKSCCGDKRLIDGWSEWVSESASSRWKTICVKRTRRKGSLIIVSYIINNFRSFNHHRRQNKLNWWPDEYYHVVVPVIVEIVFYRSYLAWHRECWKKVCNRSRRACEASAAENGTARHRLDSLHHQHHFSFSFFIASDPPPCRVVVSYIYSHHIHSLVDEKRSLSLFCLIGTT